VVRELIRAADAASLKASFDRGETVTLEEGGTTYIISASQVSFFEELPPGLFQAPMSGGSVYVDVTLTPELEAEGYAREVIRRVQEMRRQLDLRVEDYVTVRVTIDDRRVAGLLSTWWSEGIRDEVRAVSLEIQHDTRGKTRGTFDLQKDWDVEGIAIVIGISKIADETGKE
jgi:isoleucyl-tRNA synthetase